MNRAILAEILGSDYNILEATNGRECLAMLERFDTGIALILLDIVMPVMDGFAVLTRDGTAQPLDRGHPRHHDLERGCRHRCAPRLRAGRSRTMSAARSVRVVTAAFQPRSLYAKQRRRLAGDEPDQEKRNQDDDLDPERGRRVPQRRERPASKRTHRHADPAPFWSG